jgi:hypothetical protein
MPSIIDNRNDNTDPTIKIFDNFYSTQLVVNSSEFDIVYGYFRNVCSTAEIAGNFTTLLFTIAQQTGENVLTLLQAIQGAPNKLQMNKLICFYLNSFRSKVALYGVGQIPRPNESVARNVVQ